MLARQFEDFIFSIFSLFRLNGAPRRLMRWVCEKDSDAKVIH